MPRKALAPASRLSWMPCRVTSADTPSLDEMCDLLADAVRDGASVGFLAPLPHATAVEYWTSVYALLDGDHYLWIVESEGKVIGSVQLAACTKPNGRHRAEVQKLLVRTTHRGQGLATRLMAALESFSQSIGCTLLVLDTESGSSAEGVYRHMGWQRVGEIPEYAGRPDGQLIATAVYFKRMV